MTKQEQIAEAYSRATIGQRFMNYPSIYEGFAAMGIADADILPRENVLTFNAWRALGRTVRKGQHGVKVVTWVSMTKKTAADDGTEKVEGFRRPKTTTVFHVSQTDAL